MSPTARLAFLLLASVAGCGGLADEPSIASAARGITYGSADDDAAHAAVVALAGSDGFFCTGTLVAPRVVLTAAHCVDRRSVEGLRVGFGDKVADPAMRWVKLVELSVHPEWSRPAQINDFALLRLGSPAPSGVKPIPALPARLALGADDVGTVVEFSGFGRTEAASSGLKLKVSDGIDCICEGPASCSCLGQTVGPGLLCYDQKPGGPCTGDSGGPAFLTVDGQEYVAGITSYGDPDCVHYGCSTKVDRHEELIRAFVGETGVLADGAPCGDGAECQSGFCVDGVCCSSRCEGPCDACGAAAGAGADGVCSAVARGCDDGDPCTVGDACAAGVCLGTPKSCPGPDDCHAESVCDSATGECLPAEALGDGHGCSDGDPCTVGDLCVEGRCSAGAMLECPEPASCQLRSLCDRKSGQCLPPGLSPDGAVCDDGDPRTEADACVSGVCAGHAVASPECPDGGACEPRLPKTANAEETTGCGCAAGAGSSAPLVPALLALLLPRRRWRIRPRACGT